MRKLDHLVALLAAAAIVPAFITNTIYTTALLPIGESFQWAWFDIGATRLWFGCMLFAGLVAAVLGRRPSVILLLAPLMILVAILAFTKVDRIGAAEQYGEFSHASSAGKKLTLDEARRMVREIERAQRDLPEVVRLFPSPLPSTMWLKVKIGFLAGLQSEGLASNTGIVGERQAQRIYAAAQLAAAISRVEEITEWQKSRRQCVFRDCVFADEAGRLAKDIPLFQSAEKEAQRRETSDPSIKRPIYSAELADLAASLRTHQRWLDERWRAFVTLPYTLAATLLLLFILWHYGIRNWLFASLVVMAALAALWSAWHNYSGAWQIAIAAVSPLFIGVTAAVVWRFAFRARLDNTGLRNLYGGSRYYRAMGRAGLFWLPIALLAVFMIWLGTALTSMAVPFLYCGALDPSKCLRSPSLIRNSDPVRDTFRDDVHIALDREFARFEAAAIQGSADVNFSTTEAVDIAKHKVMGVFDNNIKSNLWDYEGAAPEPSCGFLDIGCHLKSIPYFIANRSYKQMRDKVRASVDARMTAIASDAKTLVGKATGTFATGIADQANAASVQARKATDILLLTLVLVFSVVPPAYVLVIAIRGYLRTLSKTLFAPEKREARYTTITNSEPKTYPDPAPSAELRKPGAHILATITDTLRVKRAYDFNNVYPATPPRIYQWTRWPLARLRRGAYLLKRANPQRQKLTLSHPTTVAFVVWDIPDNERVAFRWDTFVGMSSTVTLEKRRSLKLGLVALYRFTTPVAVGPGLLILKARAPVSTANESVAPHRFHSWVIGAPTEISAEATFVSIYLDCCHLRTKNAGQAVIEGDVEGLRSWGLMKEFGLLVRNIGI